MGPQTVMSMYWEDEHAVGRNKHCTHRARLVGDWYQPVFPFHWLHSVGHVRFRHAVALSAFFGHGVIVQAVYWRSVALGAHGENVNRVLGHAELNGLP